MVRGFENFRYSADLVVLFWRFGSSTASLVGVVVGGGCLVLGEGSICFFGESFGGGSLLR
jgi:hypothetical protein